MHCAPQRGIEVPSVLLHVHADVTTASLKRLRYDVTGISGCKGEQLFSCRSGKACVAHMGFESAKSRKSEARNSMEMALRRLPLDAMDQPAEPTPAGLRGLFVDLCVGGKAEDAAPLLGDVVLLTYMSDDLRASFMGEEAVRSALEADLEDRLARRGMPGCVRQSFLRYSRHLSVVV